jgi:hypothetical protein
VRCRSFYVYVIARETRVKSFTISTVTLLSLMLADRLGVSACKFGAVILYCRRSTDRLAVRSTFVWIKGNSFQRQNCCISFLLTFLTVFFLSVSSF